MEESDNKKITSINWHFGDDTTISTKNIHNYSSSGTFSAIAEVSLENRKYTISPKKTVEVQ